jgi:hypothetical protein
MSDRVPKRNCFVGLFDILGFSNMVKKYQLDKIWEAYNYLKSTTSFMKDNIESIFKSKLVNIEMFSDTFLMCTANCYNQTKKDACFNALLGVCDGLFQSAIINKMPIRGAITYGEVIVNDNVIIGKPIVEAYEMEQKQDWMGCWINDNAIKKVGSKLLDRHEKGKLIIKYKVPFKSGEIKECYVFNWVQLPFEGDYDHGALIVKPGHDWPAERKHINTKKYIRHVQVNVYKR